MDARGPRIAPLTCGDTVILRRSVHKRKARIAPGILLITQRSQVQILPPLQVKVQVRGPFDLRIGGAFVALVCSWYAGVSGVRTWTGVAVSTLGAGGLGRARTSTRLMRSGTDWLQGRTPGPVPVVALEDAYYSRHRAQHAAGLSNR